MKKVLKKKRNWKKIIGYSAITLVLACVFVVGFFAIKTGKIFGKAAEDYVDVASVEDIPVDDLKITGQEDYKRVLTSDSTKYTGLNALPEIPEANTAYEKGTKENPLVLLEIVPELSQQSLTYFASSKEEGLPFDPLEMSMKLSKERRKENSQDAYYVKSTHGDVHNKHVKKSSWDPNANLTNGAASWVKDMGGIFSGTNSDDHYQIYDFNHSVPSSTKKTNGHDYDFSDSELVTLGAYFTVEMEKDWSFVEKNLIEGANVPEKYNSIAFLYDGNEEFRKAFVDKDGKEIPREVIDDDPNWAWNIEADTENNKEFSISVSNSSAEFESDYTEVKSGALDKKVFLERYKDILSKTDSGMSVSDDELARTEAWTVKDAQEKYKGYFVYVGKGNGQVALDVYNGVYYEQWTTNNNAWNYVENDTDLSTNAENLWPDGKESWKVSNNVNNAKEGQYVPASRFTNINANALEKLPEIKKEKIYSLGYKYEGYKIKFEYIGLKWNDVLKRMLFNFTDEKDEDGNVTLTADQQYANYHIKIIAVTPDMINEMDKNDTEDTLDYIERADMFYVSSYYGIEIDAVNKLRTFFWKYIDPDKETVLNANKNNVDKMVSFEDNDLEWADCMKIIKRLSGDAGLPMMFSKQMGLYLNNSTDKVCNKVFDTYYVHNENAGLCNLAKLFLISTEFDLSASTTSENKKDLIWCFMDNVYGNIKQVKLVKDSSKETDNTAVYTGYYKEEEKGTNPACQTDDKDSKYTFLWNLYTFLPYVTTASEDALFETNGTPKFDTFINKYGFLASSLVGPYMESVHGAVSGQIPMSGYNVGFNFNNPDRNNVNHQQFFYTRLTGTRDPLNDYQNVTIVMKGDKDFTTWQDEQNNNGVAGTFIKGAKGNYYNNEGIDADPNFTIIDKGVMSRIAMVLSNILKNAKAPNPTMKFNVDSNEKSKKYYQKMSNSNVLIDFNQSASYNENRSKEKNVMKLFCTLNNSANKENSIITSIKMVDPNDSSKPPISIDTIYDTDNNIIKKENDIGFSQTLPTPKKYAVEFITGYKVTSNNAKYCFVVPFKLSDWQKGYTQIRIDWVARSSRKVKGKFSPYQNPSDPTNSDIVDSAHQYAEIDIGERELFDLE